MFGGEVIYIFENSKTHLNPLDLTENPNPKDTEYDPIKAKYDFFLSFFSTILGNVEISAIQKTIIDVCLRKVHQEYTEPTLREYYEVLERFESENNGETKRTAAFLRQALSLYVHGSMNIFSNKTNVDIKKRIVVYDIKDLGKNLQTLGMMIVLENLWDKVARNRARGLGTRIYIDEMYLLFKSEQSATFFYELYKRARKWGGIPSGITQNVEDLLRSEMARSMLANTEFLVMLNQNATDREKLAELLKISPETMSYVTRAESGSGLIYAGKFGVIPFYNKFPTDTNLYKIMSTRFGEDLEKLKSEKGNVKKNDLTISQKSENEYEETKLEELSD
jgi:type IV secretory pathway VirB4 component